MLRPGEEVAAGFFLARGTGATALHLLLQNRRRGEWGFPKGHLRRDEHPLRAALRECAEECGIGLLALRGGPWELAYLLPDGRRKRVVYWAASTAQTSVILSREHRRAAWLDAAGVVGRLPFPDLAALFRRHLAELRPC